MNLESRSRSLSSLFSMKTCFKASCGGEPSFSHFVFWRAVAEIESCVQQLYRMDESQLCLSTTWCNMLIHFSLSSSAFPSHVIADHQRRFVTDLIQGASSLHPPFFAFFASLDLMFLQRCQTSTWCSTPRSLYSVPISALIPVCRSVPTTQSTGIPVCALETTLKAYFLHCLGTCCFFHMTDFKIDNFFGFFVHHGVCAVLGTISRRVTAPVANKSYRFSVQEIGED